MAVVQILFSLLVNFLSSVVTKRETHCEGQKCECEQIRIKQHPMKTIHHKDLSKRMLAYKYSCIYVSNQDNIFEQRVPLIYIM